MNHKHNYSYRVAYRKTNTVGDPPSTMTWLGAIEARSLYDATQIRDRENSTHGQGTHWIEFLIKGYWEKLHVPPPLTKRKP